VELVPRRRRRVDLDPSRAGTDTGMDAKRQRAPDAEQRFPASRSRGSPPPLAITVRQTLIVTSSLGVKEHHAESDRPTTHSRVRSGSDIATKAFEIGGPGAVLDQDGTWPSRSTGLSLGAAGMNLSHQMRVVVGVGAFGFRGRSVLSVSAPGWAPSSPRPSG